MEEKFSFETFMEKNFKALKIHAIVFGICFIDSGVPEGCARARAELKEQL